MTNNLINQKQLCFSFSIAKTHEKGVNAIKNAVFYKQECPDAKSGRSKRKSGAPDFFRLPCGAGPFLVYRWYTLPSRLMQKMNKQYTSLYTPLIKELDYE